MQIIDLDAHLSRYCPRCGSEKLAKTSCLSCGSETIYQFDLEAAKEEINENLNGLDLKSLEIQKYVTNWLGSPQELSTYIIQTTINFILQNWLRIPISNLLDECKKKIDCNPLTTDSLEPFISLLSQVIEELDKRIDKNIENPLLSVFQSYQEKYQSHQELLNTLRMNIHAADYETNLFLVEQSESELSDTILKIDNFSEVLFNQEKLHRQLTPDNKREIKLIARTVEELSNVFNKALKFRFQNFIKRIIRFFNRILLGGN